MADNYTVLGSSKGVQVLSETQVADVQYVSIITKPSGTALTIPVPLAAFTAGSSASYLTPPAELVEQLMEQTGSGAPLVTAVAQVQVQTGAKLLASYLNCTVTYVPSSVTALPFSTVVQLPLSSFLTLEAFAAKLPSGKTPSDLLEAAYAQLESLAGS